MYTEQIAFVCCKFNTMKKIIYTLLVLRNRVKYFLSGKHVASFPYEIAEDLKIPLSMSMSENSLNLSLRSDHEVLFRMIAAKLFKLYSHKEHCAIIDIGAWIGDNSLVWARMAKGCEDWKIIAIDPSPKNILFVKSLAEINCLDNIDLHQSLCSAEEGMLFGLDEGSLDHGSFKETFSLNSTLAQSTTLSKIFSAYADKYELFMLHLDVEGQELDALRGASSLLDRFNPFVVFEGHIKSDSLMLGEIHSLLCDAGYSVWMINEILPGCNLDCRNFLAVHYSANGSISNLQDVFYDASTHPSFFPATADPQSLIKI